MLRICIWAMFLAVPALALSDTIKVGEELYKDVYVESDEDYYYIHFPEDGKIEKVSRKRQDVGEPLIETDEGLRNRIIQQFKAKQAMAEKELAEAEAKPASELTNEAVEADARLKSRALFDAQVEYWKSLSEDERGEIEDYLVSLAENEQENYALVRREVSEDIVDLEAQKAMHEARLAQLAQLKQQALAEAQRRGRPDLFMELYQASVYDYAAVPHGQAIASLNTAIEGTVSAGVAEEGKSVDSGVRVGTFLARIEQLSDAVDEEYESPLSTVVVESWKGSESLKTAPFEITAPVWRLDCMRDDLGNAGEFAITVFDAETDRPFTSIGGVDFLQMRVRLLDGPGRYYLQIDQDGSNIPYEIKAVTFSE